MVSFGAVSIGVCFLSSMTVLAHADVLDQLRVASTGPFTFTISPASSLPAAPRDSVNLAPLSAKPATSPATPADGAAQPEEGDVAAKAAKQHDEDAANAGLHVAPRQQKETDEPADHPALSEMTRANAVPPEAVKTYTPIPTDIGSLLSALTRTRGRGRDKRRGSTCGQRATANRANGAAFGASRCRTTTCRSHSVAAIRPRGAILSGTNHHRSAASLPVTAILSAADSGLRPATPGSWAIWRNGRPGHADSHTTSHRRRVRYPDGGSPFGPRLSAGNLAPTGIAAAAVFADGSRILAH